MGNDGSERAQLPMAMIPCHIALSRNSALAVMAMRSTERLPVLPHVHEGPRERFFEETGPVLVRLRTYHSSSNVVNAFLRWIPTLSTTPTRGRGRPFSFR